MTSRALVPISQSTALPAARSAGQGSIAVRARKRGLISAQMDVEAVNNTDTPMMCAFTTVHRGRETPFGPQYVWIDPHTTGTIPLRVPWTARTLAVRLRGSSADYRAQSDVPPPRIIPFLAVLAVLLAIAAGVAAWLRPAVRDLSVPARVYAGDTVQASYAFRGIGQGRYVVTNGSSIVAQGALTGSSGTFSFGTSRRAAAYAVAVTVRGFEGAAQARATVIAGALPQAAVPIAIASLAVVPPVAVSGKPFLAKYSSNARSGIVKLIDDSGVEWDAQPYRDSGTTPFIAPHVDRERHFAVRLEVQRGQAIASAATGLVVVPATPSPSPSPTGANLGILPPQVEAAIAISPKYIVSGSSFSVRAQTPKAGTLTGTVILQNENGSAIASTPANGARPVTFSAPVVTKTTRYFIVATVANAKSSQLVVTPIDVHAVP